MLLDHLHLLKTLCRLWRTEDGMYVGRACILIHNMCVDARRDNYVSEMFLIAVNDTQVTMSWESRSSIPLSTPPLALGLLWYTGDILNHLMRLNTGRLSWILWSTLESLTQCVLIMTVLPSVATFSKSLTFSWVASKIEISPPFLHLSSSPRYSLKLEAIDA